jgi:hypothetical protein
MHLVQDTYWARPAFLKAASDVSALVQDGRPQAAHWRLRAMADAARDRGLERLSRSGANAANTLRERGVCGALGANLIALAEELSCLRA